MITSAALCLTAIRRCKPPAFTITDAVRSTPRSLALTLTWRLVPTWVRVTHPSWEEKAFQLSLFVCTDTVCSDAFFAKVSELVESSSVGSSISLFCLQAGINSKRANSPIAYFIFCLISLILFQCSPWEEYGITSRVVVCVSVICLRLNLPSRAWSDAGEVYTSCVRPYFSWYSLCRLAWVMRLWLCIYPCPL